MMHVTKMHIAFLNSLGRKGNNQKLANMVIETVRSHARIQEEQQTRLIEEGMLKQQERMMRSLDVV